MELFNLNFSSRGQFHNCFTGSFYASSLTPNLQAHGVERKADMLNIQQMWPAEAFYLARKAQDFAFVACIFPKNIL